MSNILFQLCDYEHLLLLIILMALFILGLKKISAKNIQKGFVLDRSFSGALKGMAAVLILMGHYAQMKNGMDESNIMCMNWVVSWSTANIALVWFMFISGYGLTVSKKNITNHLDNAKKRLSKVFNPMLFVFVLSIVLYCVLPYPYTSAEARSLAIPTEINMLPNEIIDNIVYIIGGMFRWYWYPWCAIILYICYYIADYISSKHHFNKSWTLLIVLTIYYIVAFIVLGSSLAHYYRLVWSFFMGHLFVQWNAQAKWQSVAMTFIALSTLIFEDIYIVISFVASIVFIIVCSWLNKRYEFNNKYLLELGGLSYFYYLCHRRIVWPIMCSFGCHDLTVWCILSLLCSMLLLSIYSRITKIGKYENSPYKS